MNAPENDDPFAADLARMAGDIVPAVDGGAMAGRAIRREKQRRVVVTAAACVAAMVAVSAAIGAAGTVSADRRPLPAAPSASSTTDPASPTPTRAVADGTTIDDPRTEPLRVARTGDGELPVMPGVRHGVTGEGGAQPYIFGGLWYEVPPGGWEAVGDVTAGGAIGWLRPSAALPGGTLTTSIDDVVADIELRNVTDVAGWTVPPRDSGAMTLPIEGADLVVIEPGDVVTEQRDGRRVEVRPVTTRIGSGSEGWIIETRFPADAAGDTMLRDFLGNLWLKDFGEPEWYDPMYTYPEIGPVEHAVPAGWTPATTGGLSYAYPGDWSPRENDGSTFGETVEIVSDEVVVVEPAFADPEVRWNGYVESGDPGANFWPGIVDEDLPGTSRIDVPGADYAVLNLSEGPHHADENLRALSVELSMHQAGDGNHAHLTMTLPPGKEGTDLLRRFLGTLSYDAG